MIDQVTKPPCRIIHTAYDFEWQKVERKGREEYEITLCGAYDETGYRWYVSAKQFLRAELIPKHSGRFYYAHFGGASDMVFLLQHMLKDHSLSIKGVFSGSSAILVTVTRGDCIWHFVDSFWLMRTRLANIGAFLGMPKLEVDFDTVSFAELKTYNERDCKILYDAVALFQDTILAAGGELGVTAASTAMKTFLRRYLKRPIKNGSAENDYAREAYKASRVERIRDSCTEANVFDINSSFPYSMTFPCPGQIVKHWNDIPQDEGKLWIAEVTLKQDVYLPAIPWRSLKSRKMFFPNGTFRTRITSEDFKCGGFDVLAVHSCREYEDRDDMSAFATDFYAKRKGAGEGSFESEVWKILLNSLYGKWAEREEKRTLIVRPKVRLPHWEPLAPHIYLTTENVRVPHAHVPFSVMITSRSRRLLLEHMREAERGGKLYYCDTDSVICDALLPCSTGLGALKLEKQIRNGRFVGSKLYAFQNVADGRDVVKAKGFSRIVSEGGEREPLSYDSFISLTEGRAVQVERMLRIRELLRKEGPDYSPRSILQTKALGKKVSTKTDERVMPRPKRCPTTDGDSRPWQWEELKNE